MKKRDQTRLKIKNASSMNKSTLLTQDKILRNKVNHLVKKDNMAYNKARINKAKNENEIWRIVNDVTQPKKDVEFKLRTESGSSTSDNQKVADIFNDYFVTKIITYGNVTLSFCLPTII